MGDRPLSHFVFRGRPWITSRAVILDYRQQLVVEVSHSSSSTLSRNWRSQAPPISKRRLGDNLSDFHQMLVKMRIRNLVPKLQLPNNKAWVNPNPFGEQ